MERVLNKGLNFSILPKKLDITQVMVDWKKFERTMIWTEWWHGHENINNEKAPIFKVAKQNLPKNYTVPKGLQTYIGSVRSEIVDPKNRLKVDCNLPEEELRAMQEFKKLQRERKIIIKQCDKGAGILIIDFKDYMAACEEHLNEEIVGKNGKKKPYYKKVSETQFEEAKIKLLKLLQSGFDNEIITKQEYSAMCPQSKSTSRFYCNFKIHKDYEHIPPVRAIISGSGSILENPSKFVDHYLKDIATKHDTYLQDTPDFIRKIEEINSKGKLSNSALLVSFDVRALFTNIPQEEGTSSSEEALNERESPGVPTEYIISLLRFILENNIFSFNDQLYSQQEGTSMGPKHAPHYADIFMARKIDPKIKNIFRKFKNSGISFLKRFLDDLFKIYEGTTQNLHNIFQEINNIHPSIKFTMSHTSNIYEDPSTRCDCPNQETIPFLDTSCKIVDGRIILDLYKKPYRS